MGNKNAIFFIFSEFGKTFGFKVIQDYDE